MTQQHDVHEVSSSAAAGGWLVEMSVDPQWYSGHGGVTIGPCPAQGPVRHVELQAETSVVGRQSISRKTSPELDCSPDAGVSRQHASLTVQDGRLHVQDMGSSNGTFVAGEDEDLPELPIPVGRPVELVDGDRIYLGAWTRLVVRRSDARTVRLQAVQPRDDAGDR